MLKKITVLSLIIGMSACSGIRTMHPTALPTTAVLCLVKNTNDKQDEVVAVLKDALAIKQVKYQLVDTFNSPQCPWQMTYAVSWVQGNSGRFNYGQIKMFHEGVVVASAEQDARHTDPGFRVSMKKVMAELVMEVIQ